MGRVGRENRIAVPFYCPACCVEVVSKWSHVRSARHKRNAAQVLAPWAR